MRLILPGDDKIQASFHPSILDILDAEEEARSKLKSTRKTKGAKAVNSGKRMKTGAKPKSQRKMRRRMK